MPKVFEQETFKEWSRQYGDYSSTLYEQPEIHLIELHAGSDVVYMNVLGQSIVVVDKYETAVEILDKRSGIYSGRFVPFIPHSFERTKANV
jgi:hypothetical protein